jgi:RimJ/RimL family protein N-acetyltransferase
VKGPDFIIRRLEPEADAGAYRDIRLESLRRSPEAFSSDFASESRSPTEFFAGRLADSHVLGGFRGDDLVGMAGMAIERPATAAHKGFVWGVYVRQRARRMGLARSLVEAILAHAAGKVERLNLTVERRNLDARRLYASLGFVEYGLEPDARKIGGHYYDDILMALDLRPD